MSALSYILVANICVWLLIFAYLAYLQLRYRKLQGRIENILKITGVNSGDDKPNN